MLCSLATTDEQSAGGGVHKCWNLAHGQGRDQVSQKLAVGEAQKMGGMIGCLVEDV